MAMSIQDRERRLARGRERWHARKARGMCAKCGKVPPVPGQVNCAPCREVSFQRGRKISNRRKDQGVCKGCGQQPPNPGKTLCKGCADNNGARSRLRRTGCDADTYDALFLAQGGKCAICERPPSGKQASLHADHDHATEYVRGLLCVQCNRGIGMLGDNVAGLKRALRYLEIRS